MQTNDPNPQSPFETLDDQTLRALTYTAAGRIPESISFLCTFLAILGTSFGIPLAYHEPIFSRPAQLGGLFVFVSAVLAFISIIFAIVSRVLSRRQRGSFALILAIAVLVGTIGLTIAFPTAGLRNIH